MIFESPFQTLTKFVPSLPLWWKLGPVALLYALLTGGVAGVCRRRFTVRVAYTRKIFHFLIIPFAAVVQVLFGVAGTVIYGSTVSTVVVVSVWYGAGFHLYDALARPDDAPRQSLFIIVPLVMTGLGGVLSNILFGPFATVGYWVCGFGDAVGEPVGSRWGRHSYEVPSMAGVSAERTLEGSLAVSVASSVAAWVGLIALGVELFLAVSGALLIGLVGAGVEAISTHGLDNLTTQLAAAGLAYLVFGF